jgi:Tfp pilus assembly protein PilN
MSQPARIRVNLLPKDPFLTTPVGRLLQWALSVGRYLVIFTELVVILSFATRFSLDRRVTDLNGSILQKKIIIGSYGTLEQDVRDVQKKIDSYTQVEQKQNLADIFPIIGQVTPSEIQLRELSVQAGSIAIAGTAPTNTSLNVLINNIQLTPKFSDVTVERIETSRDTGKGFEFRIRAQMKL